MKTNHIVVRGCLSVASLILPVGACAFEGANLSRDQSLALDSVDALPKVDAAPPDLTPDARPVVGFTHDSAADFRGVTYSDTVYSEAFATAWGTVEPLAVNEGAIVLADGVGGVLTTGFEVAALTLPIRSAVIVAPLIDESLSKEASDLLANSLGVTGADSWSARRSGQFRIDDTGNYDINAVSPFGHRLTIDGARVKEMVVGGVQNDLVQNLFLTAGWHDLVFDTNTNDVAGPIFATKLLIGPTGQALSPLAADHLRPVVTGSERLAFGSKIVTLASANGALKNTTIAVSLPAGAVVTGFDVSASTVAASGSPATVQLLPKATSAGQAASAVTVAMNQIGGRLLGSGTLNRLTAVAGDWIFSIKTNPGVNNKLTISDVYLTVHYQTTSTPSIAPSANFVRTVDLGRPATINSVNWEKQQPANSVVSVQVRACQEKCADDVPFTSIDESGSPTEPVTGQFVDYRVGLVSDGISVPAVTKIVVAGVAD
jgi:hypothetical protein